jgi:hypothetical protein
MLHAITVNSNDLRIHHSTLVSAQRPFSFFLVAASWRHIEYCYPRMRNPLLRLADHLSAAAFAEASLKHFYKTKTACSGKQPNS